ncbi:TetR/AcrR family transcriptional regulator [Clostridium guangxiense]|uniref:TetR/AcrR family transcriptional regulator n=1 Tax=Clostridium guangxiense TaxID=1662055 RepID=UPI001E456949|nr:TetR/AcrR family transcriptional regulator [Clostridium guangxiense]MCD2346778.1 TetR/AcrR family transcriptional regulator [Clostridium guangxiense]
MNGFEKRRQEKKEAILYAAKELFKQYGYSKVSIAEIAKKASVSQVSIYNFFESKENLKNQLLKKLWEDYYKTIIDIVNGNESIRKKIEKFFYTVVDYSRNYTTNFVVESLRNELKKDEFFVGEQLSSIEEIITSLLEEGKKEGIIKNTITTEVMLNFIDMFRFYVINNPQAVINYDRNPKLLDAMISLILTALMV